MQESEQALSSDLAAILDDHPRERIEFDMSRVDLGKLTLMELLDASDASGVPFTEIAEAINDPASQARVFYAIAWVIMRRADKSLTFDAVCEYDLIVTGEIDEAEIARTNDRAKKVVAVAQVMGVSPEEAKGATIAEIGAATDLAQHRIRKTRRRG